MSDQLSNKFVNRDREIEYMDSIFRSFESRSYSDIQDRLYEYIGAAGLGKTALLKQFEIMGHDLKLLPIYIDFTNYQQSAGQNILEWLNDGARELLGINGDGYNDQLDEQFLNDIENGKAFFLLDSLSALHTQHLEDIASQWIVPLIEKSSTLIIIASRSKLNFGAYNHKIRTNAFRSIELLPLSEESTLDQVLSAGYETVIDDIFNISRGNPGYTSVVIKTLERITEIENVNISSANFGDFEYRIIQSIKKSLIDPIEIPEKLFRMCQILSVLRIVSSSWPATFEYHMYQDEDVGLADPLRLIIELSRHPKLGVYFKEASTNGFYELDGSFRRALSALLRFEERELYKHLTSECVAFYDRLFRSDKNKNVQFVIEKLYHLADLERLDNLKWDVEIAKSLRKTLVNDLKKMLVELYLNDLALDDDELRDFKGLDIKKRMSNILVLRQRLERDGELIDRIGDRDIPNYLVETVDIFLKEVESVNRLRLVISNEGSDGEREKFIYSIDYNEKTSPARYEKSVMRSSRMKLQQMMSDLETLDDIRALGSFIRGAFLPREVQTELRNNDRPLLFSVDDPSIPWEVLNDGDNFLSLNVPVGRRVSLKRDEQVGNFQSLKRENKILLVGVSKTEVDKYKDMPLPLAAEEIKTLTKFFSSWGPDGNPISQLKFDIGEDVLSDEYATSAEFLDRISSGKYHIIHFAGHVKTFLENGDNDDQQNRRGFNQGLVLYDEIVELQDIRDALISSPLVFLNACKSGFSIRSSISLGNTFMSAGAVACISTFWDISDPVSAEFAQHVYQRLWSLPLGEVIRLAKREIHDRYPANPTWASYILFGDPNFRFFK